MARSAGFLSDEGILPDQRIFRDAHYFFRDNLKRRPVDWLFFWYAMTGYALYQLALALMTFRKQRWDRVRGITSGIRDIMRRTPLDSL